MTPSPPVDILVLAPLEEEIDALCLKVLGRDPSNPPPAVWDGMQCYFATLEDDSNQPIELCLAKLNKQGCLLAAVATCKLIVRFRPNCVVSFGIAGGFVGDDIALRDVLVADTIYYYEPAKETTTDKKTKKTAIKSVPSRTQERRSRAVSFKPSLRLVEGFVPRYVPDFDRHFKVRRGPLASGEKLIDDIDSPTRDAILGITDKMLGVEMEAAGVAAAVRQFSVERGRPEIEFVAVKGVSDDAARKNRGPIAKRVENRRTAAGNAAQLLAKILPHCSNRVVPIGSPPEAQRRPTRS